MSINKVFAIGFNKSGTTSLHVLFKSLGLTSYHNPNWGGGDDMRLLHIYDCFSDDVPKELAKLDSVFPGSRFILQVRDLESWVYSRLAHIERMKDRNAYSGGPTWDNTEYAIKTWIGQRNAHHISVLAYFATRPSDLLVVNIIRDKSAATKICNFLGYGGEFKTPKLNVNPSNERPLKHVEMLRNCMVELKIPECELRYDIYCPSLVGSEACVGYPVDSSMLEITESDHTLVN